MIDNVLFRDELKSDHEDMYGKSFSDRFSAIAVS